MKDIISDGARELDRAMALGGVLWGSAGAIVGASYTLLGAAVLFFTSLLLGRRLSINFAGNLEAGGPVIGASPEGMRLNRSGPNVNVELFGNRNSKKFLKPSDRIVFIMDEEPHPRS